MAAIRKLRARHAPSALLVVAKECVQLAAQRLRREDGVAGPAWAESELALHAGIREGVVRDGKVIGADDKQDRWFFFGGQNGSGQVAIVLRRDRVYRSETPRSHAGPVGEGHAVARVWQPHIATTFHARRPPPM